MKITSIESRIVRLPIDESLAGESLPHAATRDFVILTVGTDAGAEGIGLTSCGGKLTAALKSAVDGLGQRTLGEDPLRIEHIVRMLRAADGASGPAGIFTMALAAIDIALWDIKGKAFNVSVAKLAGGCRERLPTYASGALGRDLPLDQVVKAGPKLVEKGFRQMKTQLALPGLSNPEREVERIRLIRESVGDDIDLMCDINKRWDVRQAISIGKRIDPYHLFWLEDVVTSDDPPGLASVAAALDTPIAAGEYVYGMAPFRHMLEARAVDIVMIDVMRAGGITQWLKIAAMAEGFNMPVVSHLYPEISVHLMAAIPHGLTVEYMPWSFKLFEEVPVPENGVLVVPDKPGLGLTFDRDTIKRYAIGA